MSPDLSLTLGLILAVFAIPSIVSAFSDARSPRVSALVLVVSGALVAHAMRVKEGGYTLREVPDTMIRVIATFIA
ncbi:hypothetical protein [Roseivivax sediminis]|uniref:Uncharacterized protein n=1 Tax=Roseivivax sediminis TaxID=936889 RepID=A0A1I2C1H7_9RHOB|nr:hypothetical protein [Roseivivax sediminis]SFE62221.1 hypothetical protein SAMN04515678_11275 [Roseivivax sediminis]